VSSKSSVNSSEEFSGKFSSGSNVSVDPVCDSMSMSSVLNSSSLKDVVNSSETVFSSGVFRSEKFVHFLEPFGSVVSSMSSNTVFNDSGIKDFINILSIEKNGEGFTTPMAFFFESSFSS